MAHNAQHTPDTGEAARRRADRAVRAQRPYGAPSSEALALLVGVGVALVVMVALIAYLWT